MESPRPELLNVAMRKATNVYLLPLKYALSKMYRTSSHHLMNYSHGPPARPPTSDYITESTNQAARHMMRYMTASQNGHPLALDSQTGIPEDLLIYRALQKLIVQARRDLLKAASARLNITLDSPQMLRQ